MFKAHDGDPTIASPECYMLLCEPLPLTVDAEDVFVHVYGHSDYAFWLDSSLIAPHLSRWSFMGDASGHDANITLFDAPRQTVQVLRPVDNSEETLTLSIFDYLERRQASLALDARQTLPDIPFLGGHVGYFGYELKTLTCNVSSPPSPYPNAAFLFCTRFLAFDHVEKRLYVVAVYRPQEEEAARGWAEAMKQTVSLLPSAPPVAGGTASPPVNFALRQDRDTYLANIEACLAQITAGETYEVCLTNDISAQVHVDPLDLYRRLRRRNPAPYAAYLRFGELAVACSSPERFLRIERDGIVETKPIKGTSPRDDDPARDAAIAEALRLDEKSRAENLMIVDLMRNDLGRVCEPGSVNVPSLMHIESYRTVHQLVSVIQGRLGANETALSCIASCFPGGSMTGAPKIRTLEIIDALEDAPRGIYSGAIGYLSLSGIVDLNIVIRTIVCTPDHVSVGCGGAIVALSDPIAEFDEILLKARAPLAAIAESVTGQVDAPFTIAGEFSDAVRPPAEEPLLRLAKPEDAQAMTDAVYQLLRELGGPGPQFSHDGARQAAIRITASPDLGFAYLIEDPVSQAIIGLATVSRVHALRASSEYGILQELWVAQDYRAAGLGQRLLDAVDREAQSRGWPMIEATLPMDGYPALEKLTRFYQAAGYASAGIRYRRRQG
ncbi:aminodeoxychorismate synthase component I [Lonsdalea quercina]|uniref:aminodeoxychorismate synthase component I n=1 Tax=Lonsdalea quercina TaxID=71657 RepID=UPI003974C768